MNIPSLNIDLLSYTDGLQLKTIDEVLFVKDPCRNKFIKLEPEEFVRQLFIVYLHKNLGVGYGRMVTERKLNNYQQNRFDLGVLSTTGKWTLLVECKSFRASLNQDAVIQLSKYNAHMDAKFGVVTNGNVTYAWSIGEEGEFISEDSELIGKI